jgi:DNA polymerase-3 subunit alpha
MMDSATTYKQYLKKAKELGMTAIAFSEHGVIYNWIKKKLDCDDMGIKYIHGEEFYITTTLTEKIHESFHIGLYAKNWEGVKELNKLSSISFNKEDNHFYYRPRISIEEVMNTSDNIIVTTACLQSILWQKKDEQICKVFLNWLSKNKHRCFLEIQYHSDKEQIAYNKLLYKWSLEYGIPLIAGTDTHSLSEKEAELRSILQKSKGIIFSNEDACDLTFKSYDELVQMFTKQNALPESVYLEAIENTNKLADMVENFELDKSHKDPKISDNAEEELHNRMLEGIKKRGITKFESTKARQYMERLNEEFAIFKQLNMLDYILLLDNIITFCKQSNIAYAPRGSCNGSLTLWVLEITDMDSIKFDLPFFRFCNPERVSLGDVDIDMSGDKRPLVKDFLYNYEGIQGSAIITFQTFALRGAVRGIGRGLGIPLEEVDLIAKDIDEIEEEDWETGEIKKITTFHNKEKWEKQYPRLLELSYRALGVIENASVHACGFVATDRNIDEEIGTYRTDNSKWIVSQNNMKCIDAINFVKMDFLVVDNVQIVDDVCKLANISTLKNDEMNFEDDEVWNEMLKSGLGIFQFEKSGWQYLKQTLENFEKFKETVPTISRLDVMTALNGIIRPVGASIRNDFVKGRPYKSGMNEIDLFLGETLSYIIYQEQIMMWLYNFCGYTMAMADVVRRGIAKKYGTEKLIPQIKEGFMNYCSKNYPQYTKEELENVLEKFIQVILDASSYGFSKNHSCPYSVLGFKGAYLRHYYPLEYLTVQLDMHEDDVEKTAKIIEYINKFTNIKVKQIQFRYSKTNYRFDKTTNSIFKGIKSIKYMNERIADELYELGKNHYDSFVDLLVDIKEKTSVNLRQMAILIKLNFFKEFGCNLKLLQILKYFSNGENKYDKKYVEKTKIKRLQLIKEYCSTLEDKSIDLRQQIDEEIEYLGYAQTTIPSINEQYYIVIDITLGRNNKLLIYNLKTGISEKMKITSSKFDKNPFNKLDVIKITDKYERNAFIPNGDGTFSMLDAKEWFIKKYAIVK